MPRARHTPPPRLSLASLRLTVVRAARPTFFSAALEPGPDGKLTTITEGKGDPSKDVLITVFENGFLTCDQTCEEIRKRAAIPGCPHA